MALREKQAAFCREYLVDLNATQAAIRAGYSEKCAGIIGHENLQKPKIQEEIKRLVAERTQRTEITSDAVVQKLAAVLDGSLKTVASWTEHGLKVKASDELTDEEAALIQSLKFDEKGGVQVRIQDRLAAAGLLLRHLDPIPDDAEKLRLENARLRALVEQYEIDHE